MDALNEQEIGKRQTEHYTQPDREPTKSIPDTRQGCHQKDHKADRSAPEKAKQEYKKSMINYQRH